MKILALLYLFIFLPDIAIQDEIKIKQLQAELEQSEVPAEKAELLNEISKEYRSSNPKEAILFGNKAIELAQKSDDKTLLAKAYNNSGAGYYMLGDYESAAEKYYTALKLRETIADSAGICASYNNIGNIYVVQGNYPKAEYYYQKALKLSRLIQDKITISRSLNNLGNIYQKQELYDQSLLYYREALPIKQEINDKTGLIVSLYNIGDILAFKGDYKSALDYHNQALVLAEEIKSIHDLLYAHRGLADAYRIGKNYNKAVLHAKMSLDYSKTINAKDEIKLSAELLNIIYTEIGDFRNAHFYLTLYTAYNDSIHNEQTRQQITRMQIKYESEKKEKENLKLKAQRNLQAKQLEQKSIIAYIIGILLIMAVLFAFIAYKGQKRMRSINKKLLLTNQEITQYNAEINRQKKILKTQAGQLQVQKEELQRSNEIKNKLFSIVAHDLRGPLVSLKSLLQLLAMGALPEEKLKTFAKTLEAEQQNTLWLLDNLLIWARSQMEGDNCHKAPINISALIDENIKLLNTQAQRKDILLESKVDRQAKICALADDEIIKLVLRNLISNAIKFCNAGDTITVEAEADEKFIKVTVRDSGIGITLKNQEKIFGFRSLTTNGTALEKGSGLGLALCKDFIEQSGGKIWVESIPEVGSTFQFTLPAATTVKQPVISPEVELQLS